MRALGLALVLGLYGFVAPLSAHAQDQADADAKVDGSTTLRAPEKDGALKHWWLGAYFRHLEVPGYMIDPFFDAAPAVSNNGFGLLASYRTGTGLNVLMGLGYMPYSFSGPFRADNEPPVDTELVKSDLEFIHLVGALLWDIELHQVVAFEIGFGIDVGVLAGEVHRNEAWADAAGTWHNCDGPLDPPLVPVGATKPYCAVPENGSGLNGSDKAEDEGEHYDLNETRVPPVMLFPAIPQIGLRIQPYKYLAIKLEGAFGIVQWWVGASLHASFGLFEKGPSEVFTEPDALVANGRVLGKVVEDETGVPVQGAVVRHSVRATSALSTEADGRFVMDRLDPGIVTFEIEHPDYAKGRCQVEIPQEGGDVPVQCRLSPKARVGAMSGQVQDEKGEPIGAATIELTGNQNQNLTSDARGLFAAVDLPAGTYRMRVLAEGYLVQVIEVEVEAHETAMPQVILIKKPERSLVQLKKQEIVITEQVQFKSGSAIILGDSDNLLSQVADVLLTHPTLEKIEVQGHTDSTGGHELNMKLSQSRADAVKDWLVKHGVAADRLDSMGYGPDHPIRPNDTPANRAKNRRVQFIIRAQSAEVSE